MLKCVRPTDHSENVYKYYREAIKSKNEKLYNCVLNISESNAEAGNKPILVKNRSKNKVTINKLLSKVNNINSNVYKSEKELGDLLETLDWEELNKYELIRVNLIKKLLLYNIINHHISSSFSANFSSKFFSYNLSNYDGNNLESELENNKLITNRSKLTNNGSNLANINENGIIRELRRSSILRGELRNRVILEKLAEVAEDGNLKEDKRSKYLLLLVRNYDLNYDNTLLLEILEKYVKRGLNLEREDDFNLAVYLVLLFFQGKLNKWTKWPKLVYYYDLFRRKASLHFRVPLVNDLNRFILSVDCESFPTFKSCGLLFWHSKSPHPLNHWPTLPLYGRVRVGRSRLSFGEISGVFGKLGTLDKFVLANYFNFGPKTNLEGPCQKGHFLYLLLDKSFVLPHLNKWVSNSDLDLFSEELELNLLFNDDVKLIVNNYKYHYFLYSNNNNHKNNSNDKDSSVNKDLGINKDSEIKSGHTGNWNREGPESSLLKRLLVLSDLNNLLLISRKLKVPLNFGKNYQNLNKIVKYLSSNFFQNMGARSCYNVLDVLNSIINGRNLSNNNKSILNSYFYLYANLSDKDPYFAGNNYVMLSKSASRDGTNVGTGEKETLGGGQNLAKIVDLNKLLFILLLIVSNNSKCNLNLIFNILTKVEVGSENAILFLGILTRLFKSDNSHSFLFKHYFERITELLGRHGEKDKDLAVVRELLNQNSKFVSHKFDLNSTYYNKKFILIHYLNIFHNALINNNFSNYRKEGVGTNNEIGYRDNLTDCRQNTSKAKDDLDNCKDKDMESVDVVNLYNYCYNNLLYYSNNLSDQVDDIIHLLIGLISLIYLYDSNVVIGHKLLNNINILSDKPFIINYNNSSSIHNKGSNNNRNNVNKNNRDSTKNSGNDNRNKDDSVSDKDEDGGSGLSPEEEEEENGELVRNIVNNYLLNNLHVKITPYTIQQILVHYRNVFNKDTYSHSFGTSTPNSGSNSGSGKSGVNSSRFGNSNRDAECNLEVIKMYKNVKYRRSKRIEKSLMVNVREYSDRSIIYFILFLIYDLNEKCPRNRLYRALDLALIEIPSLLKYLIILILNDYLMYNVGGGNYPDNNLRGDSGDNYGSNNGASEGSNREVEVIENKICSKLNGILLYNINPQLGSNYPENAGKSGKLANNTSSSGTGNNCSFGNELGGNGGNLDYISLNILFYLIDYIYANNFISSNHFNNYSNNNNNNNINNNYNYNNINNGTNNNKKDVEGGHWRDGVLNDYYNVIMNGLNKLYLIKCSFIIGSYARTIYYISNLISVKINYNCNSRSHSDTGGEDNDVDMDGSDNQLVSGHPSDKAENGSLESNYREADYLLNIFNTTNLQIAVRASYGHLQGSLGEFLAIMGECYLNLGDRASYEYLRLYSANNDLGGFNSLVDDRDDNGSGGGLNGFEKSELEDQTGDFDDLEFESWFDCDKELINNIWNLNRWELNSNNFTYSTGNNTNNNNNSNINESGDGNRVKIGDFLSSMAREKDRAKLANDDIKLLYVSIKEKNKSSYLKCIQNILTRNIISSHFSHPNYDGSNSPVGIHNSDRDNRLLVVNNKSNSSDRLVSNLSNIIAIYENLRKVSAVSSTNYIMRIFNEFSYKLVTNNKSAEGESDCNLHNSKFLLNYISQNIHYLNGNYNGNFNGNNHNDTFNGNYNGSDILNIANKGGNWYEGKNNCKGTFGKTVDIGVGENVLGGGVRNLLIKEGPESNPVRLELERNLSFFRLYKCYFDRNYGEYYQLLLRMYSHLSSFNNYCNSNNNYINNNINNNSNNSNNNYNINNSNNNNNNNNINNNNFLNKNNINNAININNNINKNYGGKSTHDWNGCGGVNVGTGENGGLGGGRNREKEKVEILLANYYCRLDNRLLYAVAGNLLRLLSNCSGNYRIFFAYSNFLYNLLQSSHDNLIISSQSSCAKPVPEEGLDMAAISTNIDYLYNFSNLLIHTLQVHFLILVYYSNNSTNLSNFGNESNFGNFGNDANFSNDGIGSNCGSNMNNLNKNNYRDNNSKNTNYSYFKNADKESSSDREENVVESTVIRIIYLLCHYSSGGSGSLVGEGGENSAVKAFGAGNSREDMEFGRRGSLYENINSIVSKDKAPRSGPESHGLPGGKEDARSTCKRMQGIFLRYLGAFPAVYFYHVVNQLVGACLDQTLCGLASKILCVLLLQFPHEILWFVTYFKFSKYKLLNKNYKLIVQLSFTNFCAGGLTGNCASNNCGPCKDSGVLGDFRDNLGEKSGERAGGNSQRGGGRSGLETLVLNYGILFRELQALSLIKDIGSEGDRRGRRKALFPLNSFFRNLSSNLSLNSSFSGKSAGGVESFGASGGQNSLFFSGEGSNRILVPKHQMLAYDSLHLGLPREFILDLAPDLVVLKSKQKPKVISFLTYFSPTFNNPNNNNSNSSNYPNNNLKDNYGDKNNPNNYRDKEEKDGTIVEYFSRTREKASRSVRVGKEDYEKNREEGEKKKDLVSEEAGKSGGGVESFGASGGQNSRNKFLLKNELKGDLRKDLRSQDSLKFVNKILVRHFCCEFPLYAILVVTETIGLIQFLPNLITLKQLYTNYSTPHLNNPNNNFNHNNVNKDNNYPNINNNNNKLKDNYGDKNNNFEREEKEEKEEKLWVVNYVKSVNKKRFAESLRIYEKLVGRNKSGGLLLELFMREGGEFEFGRFHEAVRAFSLSNSVSAMFGYLLGLGDRHLENVLLDKLRFLVIHVDFDLLFNANLNLLIPELVPFRLTPIIINNLGVTNVNVGGVFFRESKEFLRLLRRRKNVLELILRNFLLDPIIQWGNTVNNFVAKFNHHLNIFTTLPSHSSNFNSNKESIKENLNNNSSNKEIKESGKENLREEVEIVYVNEKVNCDLEMTELIKSATNKHLLSRMFVGWLPWV